ncbi:aminoglycoside phosphotransferase family protein [Paenirhodobacter sp.]|uniref:aminoglycoside phosphotransferase family protein n=1 Tax=Paenirhodobacter sp. TaxID=1965326 RepID=UPI003B3D20CE
MIADFLAAAGWADAARTPLAGDASARRYERLRRGDDRAVLMIAPPGPEVRRFAEVDDWLRMRGFSAPQILAADPALGLMLLEDLGDDLLFTLLDRDPTREAALYGQVTDFLLDLHRHAPPGFITPLDGPALGHLLDLTADWAPVAACDAARALPGLVAEQFTALDDLPPVMCLRDFHAQNMLWLPERSGTARLGLLDFQDAVAGHPAYDLVSALQDVRRDVSAAVETRECARYIAARGLDPERFGTVYALLGAQRALRIHGIFARLCLAMGKAQYLDLMPRNWRNLERNLSHPALAPLAATVRAAYPAPTPDILHSLRTACGTRPTP